MASLALRSIGGQLVAIRRDGREIVLHEAGVPAAPLLPGWNCDGIVDNFVPFHLVALRHHDGRRAVWVLDETMQRVSLTLAGVHGPLRAQLRQAVASVFGLLHELVLSPAAPASSDAFDGLDRLDDSCMIELASWAVDDMLASVRTVLLHDAPEVEVAGFAVNRLRATLAGDPRRDYLDMMRGRGMSCAAPDTAEPVAVQIGMVMHDRLTVYRFASPSLGAFYVTTKDYYDRWFSLYVPEARLYAANPHATDGRAFLVSLLGHVASHHARICRVLAEPRRPPVPANFLSDYPNLHIGHVIWNELSGLEELVGALPADALPEVVVVNPADNGEPFGPIEELFPEFAGRVRRPQIRWNEAAAFLYDNNLFYMRFQARYVPAAVGRRVMRLARRDPRLEDDRRLADRLAAPDRPCILLGLRVGNRAPHDQAGALAAIIDHLVDRLGQVTVVLDGANSRLGLDPSTTYASFGPPGADEPLIEELRIVFALRRRFTRSPVDIVSTVGCPVASSLFWADRCRFFVAPWGAALAKYRWICNLPGFVVTNRFNIGTPTGDLPIYHAPQFMQDPTEMRLVALDQIRDAPGPAAFYANFSIEPDAMKAGLDDMIALTGLSRE